MGYFIATIALTRTLNASWQKNIESKILHAGGEAGHSNKATASRPGFFNDPVLPTSYFVDVIFATKSSGLSCGFRFARPFDSTPLADKLVFRFGHLKVGLLQPQIALAALFVIGLFRQVGAPCSLESEAFGGRHRPASESLAGALQQFLSCNAITLLSSYTI
jgi:hypothetical protein